MRSKRSIPLVPHSLPPSLFSSHSSPPTFLSTSLPTPTPTLHVPLVSSPPPPSSSSSPPFSSYYPKRRRLQQLSTENESLKSKLASQELLIDREVLRVSHEVTGCEVDMDTTVLLSSTNALPMPSCPVSHSLGSKKKKTGPRVSSAPSAIHKTKTLLQTISRPVFVKTVLAVREIVNSKLYRASGLNLEAYFRNQFSISRAQVYRLIDCASLYYDFSIPSSIPPESLHPYPLKQRLCKTIRLLAPTPQLRQLLWNLTLARWVEDESTVEHLTSKHVREIWERMQTLDLSQYNLEIPPPSSSFSSCMDETSEFDELDDYIEEPAEFQNGVCMEQEDDETDEMHQLMDSALDLNKEYPPSSYSFSEDNRKHFHDAEVAPGVFVIDHSRGYQNYSYPSHQPGMLSTYPSSPMYPPPAHSPPFPRPNSHSPPGHSSIAYPLSMSSYQHMEMPAGSSPISPVFPTTQDDPASLTCTNFQPLYLRKRRRSKSKRRSPPAPLPPPPSISFSSSLHAIMPYKKKTHGTSSSFRSSPSPNYNFSSPPVPASLPPSLPSHSHSHPQPHPPYMEPCSPPASSNSSSSSNCLKPITAMAAEETHPWVSSVSSSTPSLVSSELLSVQVTSPCCAGNSGTSNVFNSSDYPTDASFRTSCWSTSCKSSSHCAPISSSTSSNSPYTSSSLSSSSLSFSASSASSFSSSSSSSSSSVELSEHHDLLARTIHALQELAQLGYMLQPYVEGEWVSNVERWRFHAPSMPMSSSSSNEIKPPGGFPSLIASLTAAVSSTFQDEGAVMTLGPRLTSSTETHAMCPSTVAVAIPTGGPSTSYPVNTTS